MSSRAGHLVEAAVAEEHLAHDEHRPALADQLQGLGHGAVLAIVGATQHEVERSVMQRSSCRVRCMKQLDRRWKVLLVTAVAVFMAFLDVTIVNVAFPSIEAAFPSSSLAELSWVLNAYNIVFAALLVPAGRLADLLGRRRMFFVGLGLFMAASALCGLAWSAWALVAARVLQAAGAALLVPTSLGLLLPEFPPERRASATALWGAVGGVAAATGPSLGGLLIEWADWRLVFFVNLVLGAAAWVPARRLLRETRDPGSRRGAGRVRDRAARRRCRGAGAGDRRGAGLGLGQRAGARRVRGWRRLLLAAFVVALGRRTRIRCSSSRCSACARSRRRAWACSCSRSASTPCCWPTSSS